MCLLGGMNMFVSESKTGRKGQTPTIGEVEVFEQEMFNWPLAYCEGSSMGICKLHFTALQ